MMLPVLTFIGTGIGIIGFVIFFGGFVVWARFDGAGLPADEAVAQLPRNDLVVTGASFLIPAILAAMGAVAVALVLWHFLVADRRRHRVDEAQEKLDAAVVRVERLKSR